MTQTELVPKRLDGKVAMITCENSGTGLATRFVAEGAYVFTTGPRQNEIDAVVEQIGKNVFGVQGDVSDLKAESMSSLQMPTCGNSYLWTIIEANFVDAKGLLFIVHKQRR